MRVLCVLSQYNYGKHQRGEGYEYVNFIPALRRLGHEVLHFENWDRLCYRNFPELNAALLKAVEQNQPDLVFFVLTHYEIWLETLEILREAGITATVNWTTDDSWKYSQFSRFVAPAFHAFTTTYPAVLDRYHHDGITNVMLTQWAANSQSLQPPLHARECQFPVTFVGTAHGKRPMWIEELRRRGIGVECFGYGWPNGAVAAIDIPKIIRNSVVSLNFTNVGPIWDGWRSLRLSQIKARTFEVPGAGGFLLTEWAQNIERYYLPGKEIAVFHNPDDLAEQIHYYLDHAAERDAIAQAGYARTCVEHTYEQRLEQVLEFALFQRKAYLEQSLEIPTGRIDWDKFDLAVRQHKMTPFEHGFKRALVALANLIWGPVRGPRAARRLMFEISWRLAGARTYSAAGLPGRMFYEAS